LIEAFEAVLEKIGHRVAPFDVAAAQQAGDLMVPRHKKGRPGELRDTIVAGIVLARHAALATGNTAHFDDLLVSLSTLGQPELVARTPVLGVRGSSLGEGADLTGGGLRHFCPVGCGSGVLSCEKHNSENKT